MTTEPVSLIDRDENRSSNHFQSGLLILAMTALASLVGYMLLGWVGFALAVFLTLFGLAVGQRASAAIVLRMYKARPISPPQAPQLMAIYATLCQRAELNPPPGLYYIPSRVPNAFAVGHGANAAVAITDGILKIMNSREMAGILAHELTHVRCRDTKVMGIADMISRTISLVSRLGLLMMLFSFSSVVASSGIWFLATGAILFFAPAAAIMLQLALSRTREFNADRGAALLTNDPLGLASALHKLDRITPNGLWKKVVSPGQKRQQPAMLRTHPPTEDRLDALVEIADEMGFANKSAVPPEHRRIHLDPRPRVRKSPRYHWLSGLWH